jgi:hypothetical protein
MAFYTLLTIAVLFVVWRLAKSRVMRAWLQGRSGDPSQSNVRRNEIYRTATLRQDEATRRRNE